MIIPETLEKHDHVVLGNALYFTDLSNQIYHNGPGVSSSTIRRFGVSQLHALNEEIEDTPALRFGSAAHSLIVEGESQFVKDVACLVGSPYTNANKDLRAEYTQRGLTVITNTEKETIYNMKNSLIPEADKLLHPSENEYPDCFNYPYERALYWEENGLLCKVKADVIRFPISQPHDSKTIDIIDYKTTQSVEPKSFLNSVKKYQYDLQAAWYKKAFEQAGFNVNNFLFVAQEKKPPYATKIFKMKKNDLEAGWLELDRLINEYKHVVGGKSLPSTYNTPDLVEIEL